MNKKIQKLMDGGCEKTLATLICWGDLKKEEKDSLSFEECKSLFQIALYNSSEKVEILAIAEAKAKTFEQWEWLWFRLRGRNEVLKTLITKAETLEHWAVLLSKTDKEEMGGVWSALQAKDLSFEQWKNCLMAAKRMQYLGEMDGESVYAPDEIWAFLENKAETPEQWGWLIRHVRCRSYYEKAKKEEGRLWEVFRSKAKTFEQWKWLLREMTRFNSYLTFDISFKERQRKEIWEILKDKAETPEQWGWLLRKTKNPSEKEEIWEVLKAMSETLEQWGTLWRVWASKDTTFDVSFAQKIAERIKSKAEKIIFDC